MNTKLCTCISMQNLDVDYLDLYNTALGRLKQTSSTVRHSFAEFVGTNTDEVLLCRNNLFLPPPPSKKKRRASTSPSKFRQILSTQSQNDYLREGVEYRDLYLYFYKALIHCSRLAEIHYHQGGPSSPGPMLS